MAFRRFAGNLQGATAIEYALIASLIVIVIVAAVTSLGGNVSGMFNDVAANM